LGHGFPLGAGIAKANKLNQANSTTYVVLSDGETNEGTTWEAAHFSVQHQLDNLIIIIDKNGIQGFGSTADILGDSASVKKWEALGFETIEIDGHDVAAFIETAKRIKANKNGRPKVMIAHTIKGKGVSYMESEMKWHYLPMTEELYHQAQKEITEKY
jgi:transketolase